MVAGFGKSIIYESLPFVFDRLSNSVVLVVTGVGRWTKSGEHIDSLLLTFKKSSLLQDVIYGFGLALPIRHLYAIYMTTGDELREFWVGKA